jgi:lipid A 3-O-deacylase
MSCKCGTIFILLALLGQGITAQNRKNHFSKEAILITDNDNYLVQKRDGYYTNGFYFSFQHLAKKQKHPNEKVIMRYELGQMIFNPYKYSIVSPENMDRPFAGYLYVKANRSRFFKNGGNLQYSLSVGTIGNSSGAQEVQRAYHNLINIYQVEGWGYQLKDEAGLNFGAQYFHPLIGEPRPGQVIDLHAVGKANLGNTFTNAIAGLLFRIGLVEKAEQSVAWNSRLHRTDPNYLHHREFFAFYQPEGMLQLYNATLQGGMFSRHKGPVTADIEPWLYQHRVGLMYASSRVSIVLAIIHRTKEARSMRRAENYGSIQVSYRFN